MTNKEPEEIEELYDLKEVAKILGTCTRTVSRIVNKDELPVIRIGKLIRVLPRDLARYIAARRSL